MTAPPRPPALCIAIVGAESTGKTTLARRLAESLAPGPSQPSATSPAAGPAGGSAPRVAWVPEWLRQWCDLHGRTPRVDEQAAIAREQHERIRAAAATHAVVVCDTTALMTAVYSRIVFGDRSLEPMAVALHREMHATLVTALDLPWQADGHQRDGPHVREPVDDALRELLHAHGLAYAVVAGSGEQRVAQALAAVRDRWRRPELAMTSGRVGGSVRDLPATAARASKLFTGLHETAGTTARRWLCDCCVPEAEQALKRQRVSIPGA